MTLIYGTTNPAKLSFMRETVAPLGITLLGLRETATAAPVVDESGSDPLENARLKAHAYYEALRRPVFSCGSGLYIDGLPAQEQPGTHIRRAARAARCRVPARLPFDAHGQRRVLL